MTKNKICYTNPEDGVDNEITRLNYDYYNKMSCWWTTLEALGNEENFYLHVKFLKFPAFRLSNSIIYCYFMCDLQLFASDTSVSPGRLFAIRQG